MKKANMLKRFGIIAVFTAIGTAAATLLSNDGCDEDQEDVFEVGTAEDEPAEIGSEEE